MPIDPSIPLQAKPLNVMTPFQLEEGAQNNALRNLQLQKAGQEMQQQNALRQAFSDPGGFDKDGMPTGVLIARVAQTGNVNALNALMTHAATIQQKQALAQQERAKAQELQVQTDKMYGEAIKHGHERAINAYDTVLKSTGSEEAARQAGTKEWADQVNEWSTSNAIRPDLLRAAQAQEFDPVSARSRVENYQTRMQEQLRLEQENRRDTRAAAAQDAAAARQDKSIAASEDRQMRGLAAIASRMQGSGAGYGGTYEKMTPQQQEAVDWYATMSLGGDQTWRTGLARTRGGSDLIKAVDERVPIKGAELGIGPSDVGTNKAVRTSTQAALTANTKDLATLKPYVSMLDQNSDILAKLAEKAIATQSSLANKPLNWIRSNASDNPNVAEYLAQVEIVKNEATRVISNPRLVGQMTDSARHEIESIINGSMPLNATKRVLERIKNDGQRRLSTMETQQKELQGTLKKLFPTGKVDEETPATTAPSGAPKPGEVRKGYRFKGGDPAKQESWEKQ